MNLWNLALWAAFAAGLAALVAQALRLRRGDERLLAAVRLGGWTATALLAAAFLWLLSRFIVVDLSIEYVFLYTAENVPFWYRVAGTWTGREGSLLLWALYTGLAVVFLRRAHRRRKPLDPAEANARRWTHLLLLGVFVAFLLALARQGTFDPTDPFLLSGRPSGNGVNPTLLNPYILIHPPMMFLAYALTAVPLAAGLAHLVTGTDRWSRIAAGPSRIDWVLYTVAMGLGGLWAYYTLGFGGYWAWDPVEVANLLPWLALTVYIHAQLHHLQHGRYTTVGPLLAALPFLLTVFSTISTRSGLWVSVHAFTDPTNAFEPDPALRMLGILEADPSLAPFLGMTFAALFATFALWTRRLALDHDSLHSTSRWVAAVFGALAVAGALAPGTVLSMGFAAGAALTGQAGLGALALLLVAGILAALPVLLASDDEPMDEAGRRPRLKVGLKSLLYGSVLVLSLALVVAVLWHFAAVNGWNREFWEARVPWIATPIALLLVVLMLHAQRGRQNALYAAGATAVAGGIAYLAGGLPAYTVTVSAFVVAAAIDKMQAVSFRGTRTARLGSLLLWLAAVLDLLFWLDPPAIAWLGWEPRWPTQIPMGIAALAALYGAHRVGAGHTRKAWPYLLAAVLGGYYVAPVLAAGAWILHRARRVPSKTPRAAVFRPVAVYGVHFALAILFLGYSFSTYHAADADGELHLGDSLSAGDVTIRFDGARLGSAPGRPLADEIVPVFTVFDGTEPRGTAEATLYWEPQTGSHYPLPGTERWWDRNLYLNIDAVCVSDDAVCDADDRWVQAYQAGGRISASETIAAVQVQMQSLPGISLVWGSLALFGAYGATLAAVSPLPPLKTRGESGKKPMPER